MISDLVQSFSGYDKPLEHGLLLPKVEFTQEQLDYVGLSKEVSSYDFLRHLCFKEVKNKGWDKLADYQERIDKIKYEINTFEELGFTDYILLNWDILRFCHESKITVGKGRGSGAGSIVLNLIGVTDIDSQRFNLYFERFVSKNRAKSFEVDGVTYLDGSLAPDVDHDIDFARRHEVIEYIEKKHSGRTSRILTLNTMTGKMCLKSALKIVLEFSEEDANIYAKEVDKTFGRVEDLKDSFERSDKLKKLADKNPTFKRIALKIQDLNRNFGTHPAGIAISKKSIEEIMPLQKDKDGNIISGFTMKDVSEYAVKFDVLGLRTLTLIKDVCDQVGIKDWTAINYDEEAIYKYLQEPEYPYGLFQISADTNLEVARKVKISSIEEFSDVVALARPGALSFVDEYKDVKFGNSYVNNRHEKLDEIIGETKGVILYQEQLMRIAHEVFGFTKDDAESLRRAIGKKKKDEIPVWESRIYEAAEKLGVDSKVADFYWKALSDSADYSFNKSHSVSYGILGAVTTYLKANYPKEFYVSCLKMAKYEPDTYDCIRRIYSETESLGLKILPPDLSKSEEEFSIDGDCIRYGFNCIKKVGNNVLGNILEMVKYRPQNASKVEIFQLCKQFGINRGALCSLIQSGAMSSYGEDRALMTLEAQVWSLLTDKQRENVMAFCASKNREDVLGVIKDCHDKKIQDSNGRLIFTDKSYQSFLKKFEPFREMYKENKKYPEFCVWWYEKNTLGIPQSKRLKNVFSEKLLGSDDLKKHPNRHIGKFVGVVIEAKQSVSKNGNSYYRAKLADEVGEFSIMICDSKNEKKYSKLKSQGYYWPIKDDIVVTVGNKADDYSIFANSVSKIDTKIIEKIGEINAKK